MPGGLGDKGSGVGGVGSGEGSRGREGSWDANFSICPGLSDFCRWGAQASGWRTCG